MGAPFCVFHVGDQLPWLTPTRCQQPHQVRGMTSARTCDGVGTPSVFLALRDPHRYGVFWNEQGASQRPLCHQYIINKFKKHAGIARTRPGASRRRCQQSGVYLHLISIAPTSRESIETPWKVSDLLDYCRRRYAGTARLY
jgi:hypothetical protein